MTASLGLTAIDMRVQPSWRWSNDEPLPMRVSTLKGYDRVYGTELRNHHSHAGLVSDLRRLNVRAVVQSEPIAGPAAASNERVAAVIRRDPDCILAGFGSADPRDGLAALREINRFYHELGLRGLAMVADFFNMDVGDKRCWPLYAKAAELGMLVGVHVGVNFSTNSPIRHGHPSFVDELACHFPELVIICHQRGLAVGSRDGVGRLEAPECLSRVWCHRATLPCLNRRGLAPDAVIHEFCAAGSHPVWIGLADAVA